MSLRYRMRTAACIAALSTAFYATATFAQANDDAVLATGAYEGFQFAPSSSAPQQLNATQRAQLESQRRAFADSAPEQLYPSWWHMEDDQPAYVKQLVAKLEDDLTKLQRGQLLGEFYGSSVHPFIERSGAIRTDIPLPTDAEEFEQLMQFILSENVRNKDIERYDRQFFERMARETSARIVDANADLNIFYVKDMSYETNPRQSPNLIRLMTSILVQQSDQDVYGAAARGRYGEATYNRIAYGNVGGNKKREDHVYNAFMFQKEDGLPVGVVAASANQLDDGTPTFFVHFTFRRKEAAAEFDIFGAHRDKSGSDKGLTRGTIMQATTAALVGDAMQTAYSRPIRDAKQIIFQAHTDKRRAVQQSGITREGAADLTPEMRQAMAFDAFSKLWDNPGDEFYWQIRDHGTLPLPIVSFDASTVPPGDLGTEYPEPNSEYYRELYRVWRDEVLPAYGVPAEQIETISKELRNGSITPELLEDRLQVYKPFASELFEILSKPYFKAKSFVYINSEISKAKSDLVPGGAIFQTMSGTYYVADNYPLNQLDGSAGYLKKGLQDFVAAGESVSDELRFIIADDKKDGSLDKLAKDLSKGVSDLARQGNTGNQVIYSRDRKPIPTVAGLAVFLVRPVTNYLAQFGQLIYLTADQPVANQPSARQNLYQQFMKMQTANPKSKL